MSGDANGMGQNKPTGLLAGTKPTQFNPLDRTAPSARYKGDGTQIGYEAANERDVSGTPGFSFSGMYDAGKSYQQALFKDNATGRTMSSQDAARSLIGQQPIMNERKLVGETVSSGQTAPINFMGLDGSGLSQLMNMSPFAAQAAGLMIGGTGQWDKDLAQYRAEQAQKEFHGQRGGGTYQAPVVSQPAVTPSTNPVTTPSLTGPGSTATRYTNFADMSNKDLRGAIADLQGQNGWLDAKPGNGTYGDFATRAPDKTDFNSNRDYLLAQAQWQQKRENRFGDANQASWGLQPGTPEWAAYRKSKGLPV